MSGISSAFSKGRKALIGYLTAGYPDMDTTLKAVQQMEKAGCDIVELGIPFSDPIGDGPVIQSASYRALQAGVTPAACIELVRRLRRTVRIPLVFMGYYNPIFSYGVGEFCRLSAAAGINGLIIPDLPPDESEGLDTAAADNGLDLIHLLTPTSTAERIKLVTRKSSGFIYLVSVAGVTGVREGIPDYLPDFVVKVRAKATQPLAIGFGISSPAQAGAIAGLADGVIIGSKLITLIDEDRTLGKLTVFINSIRLELDAVANHRADSGAGLS